MKADTAKPRVTFYDLLAEQYGKPDFSTKSPSGPVRNQADWFR
jgi:hypothetical protein